MTNLLHNFFENTGIYQHIRYGEDFDINKAFDIFLEETEKQMEVTYWGKMVGISMEFGDKEQIDLGEFSMENWDDQTPDCVINPYIVKGIPVRTPSDSGDFYNRASTLQLIINLYCPNPVWIPWSYEGNSLFSSNCNNPYRMYDYPNYEITQDDELEALVAGVLGTTTAIGGDDPEFVKETGVDSGRFFELQAMMGQETEEMEEREEYENKWFDFWDKAKRYFMKRRKYRNWISKADVPKFKEFISKVDEFMQSELYENVKIAVMLFEESCRKAVSRRANHKNLETPLSIINYVIILESLYLGGDVGELKEKLSNRVANLIGKSRLEKAAIRENILQIYKIRCRYLHGDTIKIDQKFRELFNIIGNDIISAKLEIWLRDIVRQSILSFFSLCKHYKSENKRKELLDILSNPFADKEILERQKQASEFLSLCPITENIINWLRRDWGKEPSPVRDIV